LTYGLNSRINGFKRTQRANKVGWVDHRGSVDSQRDFSVIRNADREVSLWNTADDSSRNRQRLRNNRSSGRDITVAGNYDSLGQVDLSDNTNSLANSDKTIAWQTGVSKG
jgi:hypothetical protein